jgi:hypothetical protein
MNVYVLRIGSEIESVYRSIERLREELREWVRDDFDWEDFNKGMVVWYDFGGGVEEEVEYKSMLVR